MSVTSKIMTVAFICGGLLAFFTAPSKLPRPGFADNATPSGAAVGRLPAQVESQPAPAPHQLHVMNETKSKQARR